MASATIFPPIMDDYIPAIPATLGMAGAVGIPFSMSSYNNIPAGSTLYAHAVIYDQETGTNIVKKSNSELNMSGTAGTSQGGVSMRYRATGVIVNIPIEKIDGVDNLYRIWINNDDLMLQNGQYYGWIPGQVYKIQIRLTTEFYDGTSNLAVWLNDNGNLFSEWSTITRIKAIGNSEVYKNKNGNVYQITDADFTKINNTTFTYNGESYNKSTFEFIAEYFNTDKTELVDNYRLKVFKDNELIDDSGNINIDAYDKVNQIDYLFKNEFVTGDYVIKLQINTINYYAIEYTYNIPFQINEATYPIKPVAADVFNRKQSAMTDNKEILAVGLEEEEGRVAIKFTAEDEEAEFTGTFFIRRTDMSSDFKIWEDIAKIEVNNVVIKDIPIYYDFTAESGVWYLYSVQGVEDGIRAQQNKLEKALIRNYNYAYLYGKDGRQLKLKFDNTMGSFNINVNDSISNTIGGKYPMIARNGNMYYHSFPVNGLISFQMDDMKLFESRESIYGEDVVKMYAELGIPEGQDFIYERDFRKKVMEFLTDGKPKLFKSATEGNFIIYLSNINFSPNQTLGRMIYTFNATGTEVADANIEMYKKFGFLEV